jgi:hypothetical protein
VLLRKDSPFFIISKCIDILVQLHNAGESAVRHMCKIEALPQFLAGLVEQLFDDESSRNTVGTCGLLAEACIKLLCDMVIKCCAENLLQVWRVRIVFRRFLCNGCRAAQRRQRHHVPPRAVNAFYLHSFVKTLQVFTF